jgi:hypothetical protein
MRYQESQHFFIHFKVSALERQIHTAFLDVGVRHKSARVQTDMIQIIEVDF